MKKGKFSSRAQKLPPIKTESPVRGRLRNASSFAILNQPQTFRKAPFKRWQLQEAKAKFSEVFDRAVNEGPQIVTRRNKEAVVIMPEADFRKFTEASPKPRSNSLSVLLECPKGPDLEIHRDRSQNVLDLPPIFD